MTEKKMLDIIILILMVVCALLTVMASDLLKSAIGLAAVSAVLAIIMFHLAAPLAAVFELSVCAGLITVVFISVISLTRPGGKDTAVDKKRWGRYIVMPLLILVAVTAVFMIKYPALSAGQAELTALLTPTAGEDMRQVLWSERSLDLFGQVAVLLTGIFGVVVLFKERKKQK